jgi:polycomb protein EED
MNTTQLATTVPSVEKVHVVHRRHDYYDDNDAYSNDEIFPSNSYLNLNTYSTSETTEEVTDVFYDDLFARLVRRPTAHDPRRRTLSCINHVPSKRRLSNQRHTKVPKNIRMRLNRSHLISPTASPTMASPLFPSRRWIRRVDTQVITTTKLSFSLQDSIEQVTNNVIYSLAWSECHGGGGGGYKSNAGGGCGSHNKKCPSPRVKVVHPPTTSRTATTNTSNTERYLATCSGPHLTIYCVDETTTNEPAHNKMQLQRCYTDSDPSEEYFACIFAGRTQLQPPHTILWNKATREKAKEDDTDLLSPWKQILCDPLASVPQLVCVGGKNAIIQVIDCVRQRVIRTLSGHGAEIHDLQVCPNDEWLLLSASKDHTCRLWNLRAVHACPVAVFGGHGGHNDAVNTISWHLSGQRFVSGGVDNTIKIWEISDLVQNAIVSSRRFTEAVQKTTTTPPALDQCTWSATVLMQFPIFSSQKLHAHYVDCVKYFGDLILSKSTENVVQLWCPKITREISPLGDVLQPPSSDITLLRTFEFEDADVWFVRFAVDPTRKVLAVGNVQGVISVWNISNDRKGKPFRKLFVQRPANIRCVSFSPDGTMLIASTDDGSIYRWIITCTT